MKDFRKSGMDYKILFCCSTRLLIYALLGFYVINLPAKTAAKRKEATISFQKTSILFVQALLYVRIYSRKHVFQPQ